MTAPKRLLRRMIAIYGFEAEPVIEFARMIESAIFTLQVLTEIVEAHETAEWPEE